MVKRKIHRRTPLQHKVLFKEHKQNMENTFSSLTLEIHKEFSSLTGLLLGGLGFLCGRGSTVTVLRLVALLVVVSPRRSGAPSGHANSDSDGHFEGSFLLACDRHVDCRGVVVVIFFACFLAELNVVREE